jgi:hypothetical protein
MLLLDTQVFLWWRMSSGDWDPGKYKDECGAGAYVVGVSSSPSTGTPHAILCCASMNP